MNESGDRIDRWRQRGDEKIDDEYILDIEKEAKSKTL